MIKARCVAPTRTLDQFVKEVRTMGAFYNVIHLIIGPIDNVIGYEIIMTVSSEDCLIFLYKAGLISLYTILV